MITKLTKKQIDSMPSFVKKWTDIVIHQKTRDIETVTKNIHWLYEQCGFESANVRVEVVDSLDEYIKIATQVWSQVQSQVWSQVWSQVQSQVWSQVQSQVWSQVQSQVRSQVLSQVRSQVWSQVWYRADDIAYGDFFYSHGMISENKELFYKYADVISDSGMAIYLEDRAILLAKPTVTVNESGQTHNDKLPAISWADGSGIYMLNGVVFPKELWTEVVSGEMPFEKVLQIDDVDQRAQAMRYSSAEQFIEHTNGKLVSEGTRENKLYRIPKGDIFTEDAYYLLYTCPSTGKKYMSGVPKEVGKKRDADEAIAWKHYMSKEAYLMMEPLKHQS